MADKVTRSPSWDKHFLPSVDKVSAVAERTEGPLTRSKNERWSSRREATTQICLLSLSQGRACMVDRRNKGGRSMVLRCSSAVRSGSSCPFYCKVRRSPGDGKWYVCAGLRGTHLCAETSIPPRQRAMGEAYLSGLL